MGVWEYKEHKEKRIKEIFEKIMTGEFLQINVRQQITDPTTQRTSSMINAKQNKTK